MRHLFPHKFFIILAICIGILSVKTTNTYALSKKEIKTQKGVSENFLISKKIDIEATNLEVDKNQNLKASGDVVIKYQAHHITSNEFEFIAKTKTFSFDEDVYWTQNNHHMHFESLNYSLKSYTGEGTNIDAKIDKLHLHGKKITFKKDKITLEDGFFSTCPSPNPHFALYAEKIIIYPAWGYLILFNGKVKTPFLPFSIYIPTYIYGSKDYGLSEQATLIPDIGTSKTEGFYIKQRFGYQISKKSKGTIGLGYTNEIGGFLSASNLYTYSPEHQIEEKIEIGSKEHAEGHIKYIYNIKPQTALLDTKSTFITDLIQGFSKTLLPPLGRASVLMQYNEIENDIRVSRLPDLSLENFKIPLPNLKTSLSSAIRYGYLKEEVGNSFEDGPLEKNTEQWRGQLELNANRKDNLSKNLNLNTNINALINRYEGNQKWERYYLSTGLKYNNELLNPEISYTKLLAPMTGESPFYFERRFAMVSDEIGINISHNFKRVTVGINSNYVIKDDAFRTIDYYTKIQFHCWKLLLKWQSKQESINFGLELL